MIALFSSQEYLNFKKFGDALLTRSGKISDIIGQLEGFISDTPDTPDAVRAKKSKSQNAKVSSHSSVWVQLDNPKAQNWCLI